MQWAVSLLKVYFSFIYFLGPSACQHFQIESRQNYDVGQKNPSFYLQRFTPAKSSKCDIYNLSSTMCQNQMYQNYQNYSHKDFTYIVPVVPMKNSPSGNTNYISTADHDQFKPVYSYINPASPNENGYYYLRSRVDQEGLKHSVKEHPSDSGHQHQHENVHGGAWGWSKGHESHHHKDHKYVKAKKKKKGPFSNLVKKFKLKRKPEKLIWKEVPECDGYENFIKDLEIISWKLGWLGFKKATIGLALHTLNQLYATFSIFIVGVPERLSTFLELVAPNQTPETLRSILAVIGLIDFIVNKTITYPLGNFIVAIELVAEVLTIASLALATITIFDDVVEEKLSALGIDVRELFEGYGCDNPFSKEKKIEKLFQKFNEW